jgi:hypothetical protein
VIESLLASAITVGASLYTLHYPSEPYAEVTRLNNNTPGVYVRTDDWVVGVVRNSIERPSFYAALNWPVVTRIGRIDFSVGAITGYQFKVATGYSSCPLKHKEEYERAREHGYDVQCTAVVGFTNAVLRPLVTVSYVVPADFAGIKPRITLLGKGLHFSLEKEL